jgi:hypothetical protein
VTHTFFIKEFSLELDANFSPNAQAARLELRAGSRDLHFYDARDANTNVYLWDVINFIYVGSDCFPKNSLQSPEVNYGPELGNVSFTVDISAANMNLKKGWNIVSGKIFSNFSTRTITIELSVVNALPSGGNWVLED